MFHPLQFPPANVNISEINLDRVYGGPSVPYGGVCELVAAYLTRMPNFGESIRVINLMGQCVTAQQVSQLFSASLSPRLPNLKSLSLCIYNRYSNLHLYETTAPPCLEHLELCLENASLHLTRLMIQPFLPLIQNVKHLGWYHRLLSKGDINSIFRVPLESLKILEVMSETVDQLGTYPSPSMPSLERLIKHDSYWVDLKQIYASIGQPFRVDQCILEQQISHKNEFCSRTAIVNITDDAELVQLKRNPVVSKVMLYGIRYWSWELLLNKVVPILSTLNELEEVTIETRIFCFPDNSSYEPCALVDLEQFPCPSVRHAQFTNAWVADIDPYIKLLGLFPKLDTLVNLPMPCFKDVQICKGLRRESLLCLRKLVLCQAHVSCINDISRCVLRWNNLDAFLIEYGGDLEWMSVLMDKLAKHKNLRHLCVIAHTKQIIQGAHPVPIRQKIEELAGAWSYRDWISMFFIAIQPVGHQLSFISAIHHGHGTIKYRESQDTEIDFMPHAFPQFYTLFWQYAKPQLYPL